ncbi:MAG: tetratricopeptide repeat protein [Saprospiraceae bacterium]|nr:tetratricopeptide repeat protein [Candidatus Opimibacter iunctus]
MSRIAELETMLDERPDDPFLIYALAREYQKEPAGTMQALLMFEHLVNHHPDYIATYYHYAKMLYGIGNQPEAIRLLELGIERGLAAKDMHAVSEMKGMLMGWGSDEDA